MFTFVEILALVELVISLLIIPAITLGFQYLRQRTKNEKLEMATHRLETFVKQAVEETSQVYVNHQKELGEWTEEHQKIAFQKSKDRLLQLTKPFLLNEIENSVSDLNGYIEMLIEAAVKEQK